MSEETQGLEFARYAWRERKLVLATCGIAFLLAGSISLLLPKQYTATASILIEPPAGSDPRAAVALSQVYLESLKTYEQFALGDTLFSAALQDLGLRAQFGDASLEALKRRIFAVSRPTNATYIQIAATLNNPKDAQRLAQYIAERAVALNNTLDQQTNSAMIEEPQRIYLAAKDRRDAAEKAAAKLAENGSFEALKKEFAAASDLRTEVGRDLARARCRPSQLSRTIANSATHRNGRVVAIRLDPV